MNNLKTYEEFNWKKGIAGLALAGALTGGLSSCEPDDNVDYKSSIDININNQELGNLIDINNIKTPCVIELSNINCGLCKKYLKESLMKSAIKYKDINFYYILTGPSKHSEDNYNRKEYVYTDNKVFNLKQMNKNISSSENIEKLRKYIMNKYDIDYFPTTIIIDKNKNTHILTYGYMNQNRLERYIKQYIVKEWNK